MVLPFILSESEMSSFILREEFRLRMFGNRVLRRKLGPERKKVAGD
jgi:hypothetical protein